MKKKFKKIICLTAGLMLFTSKTDAATLSIGNDTTSAGASRSVTVELIDDKGNLNEFTEVSFQLNVSGTAYANIESFDPKGVPNTSFNVAGVETKTYTLTGTLSAATIGLVNYKTTQDLVGDFKITPTNVVFKKADGTEYRPGGSSEIKIKEGSIKFEKPKSKDAFLTSLSVSQGSIAPEFKSDVFEYTVVVKDTINMVKVTGSVSPGATRAGGGNISLQMGANEAEIVVTAEDGETKNTYKITIVRGTIAEPSAYLKKLDINNIGVSLSPEFDKNNNKYTVKVGKDITELNFIYEREDELAEVTIEGNKNFVDGENPVTITVVSSDGEEKQIYEIMVIKGEEDEKEEKPSVDEETKEPPVDKKKTNYWLIGGIAGTILVIVIGVTIVLFKKKNKKKKNVKEESKLPLKKRAGDEPTYEIDKIENIKDDKFEQESVTDILKGELFDDDKTQKFDAKTFKDAAKRNLEDDEDDKTKEFDFKDFE